MIFDRTKLKIKSLKERNHDIGLNSIQRLENKKYYNDSLKEVALRIVAAMKKGKGIILMMGAHTIRSGVQRYLIDLMEKGYISCIAMNGGGMIHDFEFALIGATTEKVARYINEGQFGLWRETGQINDIINSAFKQDGLGMGEAIGQTIQEGKFPHKDISILAACYRLNIPATIHVGIGYDIIHEHPNCDGAATGETSYRDFLRLTKSVKEIEGGVLMNFGSAVMAPEVFLKALSMARNVAHQEGREIKHFTTLVCDLHDLPSNFKNEPSKDSAAYYFRPWKTMLVRTVADGGESYYVKGRHSDTIPALWTAINDAENRLKDSF
ncbi:MAG: hypothetical protein HOI47_16855 [Candidatus Scalindua sp.]|jgi:hypothetical protein|nr:hypothetical protein [Candidatus Scalindua sp.]MBT6228317.1 hypothetical protein [Candidatus Scalindua sp.]